MPYYNLHTWLIPVGRPTKAKLLLILETALQTNTHLT